MEAVKAREGLIENLCTDLSIDTLANQSSHTIVPKVLPDDIALGREVGFHNSLSVVVRVCLTEHVSSFSRSNNPVFGASAMTA